MDYPEQTDDEVIATVLKVADRVRVWCKQKAVPDAEIAPLVHEVLYLRGVIGAKEKYEDAEQAYRAATEQSKAMSPPRRRPSS